MYDLNILMQFFFRKVGVADNILKIRFIVVSVISAPKIVKMSSVAKVR